MRLADYLDMDLVLPGLRATEKSAVLAELVAPLAAKLSTLDAARAHKVLMERETLGTTGIGDGVAIPHGKLDSLEEIKLVVGRSPNGVEFEALDFKLCTIFFLVLAPEKVAGMHLRILAHISRLLKDDHFRRAFQEAETKEQLWELLTSA